MSNAQIICNTTLNASQQAMANKIAQYGLEHNYSSSEIEIAIKTAFIESSLGTLEGTPAATADNPNPTASGLYGYTNGTWNTYHVSDGSKNNDDNQIKAFYQDISTYE